MATTIHSERLDLVSLSPGFLRAVLEHDLAEAERILGYPLPDGLLDATHVMTLRLQQLEAEPTLEPWLLRAIVHREQGVIVGHIGFHTAPGAEYLRPYSPEGVEFGFTIFPPFGRQGFAREASMAMMNWAHQVHNVTTFVLTISPNNTASQKLAAGLGFVRIGSHIDEVDGLEDILERRIGNNASA
jgi:[ribosomal protein S5]-alanine N-acetyltransferase